MYGVGKIRCNMTVCHSLMIALFQAVPPQHMKVSATEPVEVNMIASKRRQAGLY